MKTHQLKYTKDYLLLIDEEAKIKSNDYIICETVEGVIIANDEWYYRGEKDSCWDKILAYYPLTKESKKLDLPLLPPFEEEPDIFSLMDKETQQYYIKNPEGFSHFISGYKVAQSKRFTLEDMKKAIEMATWINPINN